MSTSVTTTLARPATLALVLGTIAAVTWGPPAIATAAPATPRAAPARPCPSADLAPSASDLPAYAVAIRCLVDERRRVAGSPRLRTSSQLRRSAGALADAMVREQFFGHRSPQGETLRDRVLASGYPRRRAWRASENIAWGRGRAATPRAIVEAWMASPAHRDNLLDDGLRESGFGIRLGAPVAGAEEPSITVVEDFGVR